MYPPSLDLREMLFRAASQKVRSIARNQAWVPAVTTYLPSWYGLGGRSSDIPVDNLVNRLGSPLPSYFSTASSSNQTQTPSSSSPSSTETETKTTTTTSSTSKTEGDDVLRRAFPEGTYPLTVDKVLESKPVKPFFTRVREYANAKFKDNETQIRFCTYTFPPFLSS